MSNEEFLKKVKESFYMYYNNLFKKIMNWIIAIKLKN